MISNGWTKEITRLTDERDGYRNGQAQIQFIADGLMDMIKKYADERLELKAEVRRLTAALDRKREEGEG